jgi:uncharacterized protein YxjI
LFERKRERGWDRYRTQEKLFAIGDDFWIEKEGGERAFRVDGKAVRFRDTLLLETPSGEELFKIQEKKLTVRDKMEIELGGRDLRDREEGAREPAPRPLFDRARGRR